MEAQYDGITELKTKIEMMGMSEEFSGCKDLDRVLYMCYMRCHVKVLVSLGFIRPLPI